jgi:tripartite-type tricarboxylate transporter receptor subunit TctC
MLWRYCLACRCFAPIAIGGGFLRRGDIIEGSGCTVFRGYRKLVHGAEHVTHHSDCSLPCGRDPSLRPNKRRAENYPNHAVRVVVPFPPGGPTDTYARILADKLQTALGQSFVVENKPGATGIIGTSFVANAPADGYTLLFGANSSHVISSLLQPQRPLDPLRVFRPLSMLLSFPLYLLLNNDVPAESVADLVALGKAQPGKLNMGSVGTGGAGHLAVEMFNKVAGISAVHVPYNGVSPAQVGLMAGEIEESIAGSQTLVDAGKLRGIAVTGRERSPALPNVPTLKETGYDGFEDLVVCLGMLAPAGTPEPIAKKLEATPISQT